MKDADHHDIQITRIIPTSGPWLALFADDTARPIVCWALVQCTKHKKGYVAPMVSVEGSIIDATTFDNYIESVPEEDGLEEIYPDDEEPLDS